MPRQEDKEVNKQASKQETLERRLKKTRSEIIKTIKERRKAEKDFLGVIKQQKKYWEDQLQNTDPQNKERHDELKEKIENEELLIKQIYDELNRIDKELEQEKEHEEAEK